MQKRQQAAASQDKPQEPLPAGKAIVKAVPSGGALILNPVAKKLQGGDPYCFLAYISVPRVGNPNASEEAFAHEAREAIREKIIGKKVDFVTEYMAGNKKAVSVTIDGEDLASVLVSKSLAKVNERRMHTQEGGLHDRLLGLQEEVSKKNKGVW